MATQTLRKIIAVLMVLVTTVGALEALFRMGIFFNVSYFRDPGRYTDWTSDDDYWKLRHLWQKKVTASSSEVLDPILGWSPNRSVENPLGVVGIHPKSVRYDEPAVLMYGDSFIQGKGPWKERLAWKLHQELGSTPTYNLGVRGYGLDQIVLKFQQTHHYFKHPIIVLGILTVDLDRSVLKFRTGQKPQFVFRGDELALAGLPIFPSPQKWVDQNPPLIRSYFFSFLERQWELSRSVNELEIEAGREEKKKLSAKILELVFSEASAKKIPIVTILFYNQAEMTYVGWREVFLKQQFTTSRLPFIDSKQILNDESRRLQTPIESWYDSEGHLNERANELIAKESARTMKALGWTR